MGDTAAGNTSDASADSSTTVTGTTSGFETDGLGPDADGSADAADSAGSDGGQNTGSGEAQTSGGGSTGQAKEPEQEVCDGIDNDLDGLIDEYSPVNENCESCQMWQSGDRVYAVCTGLRTWFQSRWFCQQRGYELTTIDDAAEETRLLDFFNIQIDHWIGANDIDLEGTFVWDDGTPFEYENFANGQPSNTNNEDCAVLRNAVNRWNDVACSVEKRYICEAAHSLP